MIGLKDSTTGDAQRTSDSLNRTMIGLKDHKNENTGNKRRGLNRTMIGLKVPSLRMFSLNSALFESNYDRIERVTNKAYLEQGIQFESNYDRIERL